MRTPAVTRRGIVCVCVGVCAAEGMMTTKRNVCVCVCGDKMKRNGSMRTPAVTKLGIVCVCVGVCVQQRV